MLVCLSASFSFFFSSFFFSRSFWNGETDGGMTRWHFCRKKKIADLWNYSELPKSPTNSRLTTAMRNVLKEETWAAMKRVCGSSWQLKNERNSGTLRQQLSVFHGSSTTIRSFFLNVILMRSQCSFNARALLVHHDSTRRSQVNGSLLLCRM